MKKRYSPFMFGSTWHGIINIILGIYTIYKVFSICLNSSDPLALRIIFLVLFPALGILIVVVGFDDLKKGRQEADVAESTYRANHMED